MRHKSAQHRRAVPRDDFIAKRRRVDIAPLGDPPWFFAYRRFHDMPPFERCCRTDRSGSTVTHYKTNTHRDTEYWRANAESANLSDSLRQLYALWMPGKGISADIGRQAIGNGYPVFSWYCIMSGMGIFPDLGHLRPATASESRYGMEEIDNLLQRSALNFRSQRDVMMNIPKKVEERVLQIYFW
jgi:Tryptophan halogenase